MQAKSDAKLLRDYAEHGADSAFRELVTRHTSFVYSSALRQVEASAVAADITQGVFVDLARKAGSVSQALLPEASLAGWLHRSTRYAALNHLRDTRRRREHERQAMEQLLTNSDSAADWEQIRPALDEALDQLGDDDREALLLRYFKNQDFRAVGLALGVSDDVAQKRVSRAVERLREFFAKRGATVGAAGLVVVISANAVQAAPVGLAVTISAAALAGTAATTSTLIAATKTIAMTTLQKTLVATTVAVLAGAGIYEARQAAQLREQNQMLQQQQAPMAEQIQQLQQERDSATNRLLGLLAENARLKSNPNETELLKLRNEVTLLKQRQAPQTPASMASTASETTTNNGPSPEDVGRELGVAVVRGDAGAFDKLLAESEAERQSFKTNNIGLNEQQRNELSSRTFAPINAAFKVVGDAATEGRPPALDALIRALQIPELNGLAVHSLAGLAGNGDTGALEVLLHPEKYGVVLSGTIGALQPAADNGNQVAIEALAAVAKNQKDQPLWMMTASSLAKAAAAGNPVAIDALISMSSSTNRNTQNAVAQALRGAAANQNVKATEALRSMGNQ